MAIPFMRKLVKVTISGSSLLESFELSAAGYGDVEQANKFLQVSGKYNLCYKYKNINS